MTAAATLVTLLGLYGLRPKVLIEPYASTDPTRPFEQQFSVQNDSAYAIHDVQPGCGMPKDSNLPFRNFTLTLEREKVATLEPGAKTTLTCGISIPPTKDEINIVASVQYTALLGIRRCKAEKFKGKPGAGGVYVWTYDGSDSCQPD